MIPLFQNLEAVWCDPEKYPAWRRLPCSFFDYRGKKDQWNPAMLEFRFFFEWDGVSDCEILFSAACRFRLLINGSFAEDGPVEPGGDYGMKDSPDWWFLDSKIVSPWLKKGRNEFRFQLLPVPVAQSDYTTGYGWIWCEFREPGIRIKPEDWQFRIAPSSQCGMWMETADENGWSNDCVPVTVTHPLYDLVLPSLKNKKIPVKKLFPFGRGGNLKQSGRKLIVEPGRPATFFLELPRLTAGHLEIRINGGTPVTLFLEFQELYGVKPDQIAAESFSVPRGEWRYRTFRIYSCRYIKVDLIPSGFMTQENAEPSELEFLFYERYYPLGKRVTCQYPEPWMKELDEQCLNLLRICRQRMHLDSPMHHEGLGCTGDYRIGANIAYAAYHEINLCGADLIRTAQLIFQQKKMFHTSYELCFILMLKDYFEHGGSFTLVQECYDALMIIFEHFKSMTGPESLISEADNYLFIDWVADGDMTYHHPPANRGTAAMTALWYGALDAAVQIASDLGELSDIEMFLAERRSVRKAFNQYLWDSETQAYADGIPGMSRRTPGGWLPPDDGKKICSSLGNIMALAFGLPEEKHHPEQLLKRIVNGELPFQPTPYYMEYLFMAADRYRLPDEEKLKLFARWKPFMKEGIREHWFAGDYSHMWSASPSFWLRKKDFFRERGE